MDEDQQLFSTKAAAAYLGVHPKSIAHYVRRQWLRGTMVNPRNRVFTRQELDAFRLQTHKSGPKRKL